MRQEEDIGKFRRFYNDHLYRRLVVFEKKRVQLLFFMGLGVVLLLLFTVFILQLGMFALSVFLAVPWFLLVRFYRHRSDIFKAGYKPIVMKGLLEFMEGNLTYYHQEYISKDTFKRSRIFPYKAESYQGEDYIMGKIGEIFFELCELEIRSSSNVRRKLDRWFSGIFFHANFNTKFEGRIVMIPRSDWQKFIATMKDYVRHGGYELTNTGNADFDEEFIVYLDRNVHYKEILTPELLDAILLYRVKSGKKVYASFYNSHFYMAIDEPDNLLSASLLHSNNSFEQIANYYRELRLFTQIVRDFDVMH
ncbi:MAG: DUF3137 domain-containing protein [Aureispira sp.]